MGPMLDAKFADRYEEYLTWIQPHHVVHGASGRISAENPRDGFVGDPSTGLYYHPVVVDGVRPDDRIFAEETFGPIVGVTTYGAFSRGTRAGQRSRLRTVLSDLHHRPQGGFRVPQTRSAPAWCRSTTRPPARRRTCRSAATASPATVLGSRDLGARPVHPLAVGQLGLLRPAAEGADGHRRTRPRTPRSASRSDAPARRPLPHPPLGP